MYSVLHHVSTSRYFKEQPVYRCEVQEMRRLNYFFEIFCTFFFINNQKFKYEYYHWVNCIRSVFPHCKLQQSEVTKAITVLTLSNIDTNKINKKQSKMNLPLMTCYT